jgi:hypothetical protein
MNKLTLLLISTAAAFAGGAVAVLGAGAAVEYHHSPTNVRHRTHWSEKR